MLWAAGIGRAAYDPETISMLTTVLERAVAAPPRQDRTEERKTRLASTILWAAARGERNPILLYATALVDATGSPPLGRALPPSPLGPSRVEHSGSRTDGARLPLRRVPDVRLAFHSQGADAPDRRPVHTVGRIQLRPVLGGLHYQYVRI
jgi:hypothetical protein